jgi:predicted DNA-binding transcriptional regulator AlpA
MEFAVMSATENPKLIPDPQVARDLGITLRTLFRWDTEHPELKFPKPVYINGRKYRRADQLAAWDREQAPASIGPQTKGA